MGSRVYHEKERETEEHTMLMNVQSCSLVIRECSATAIHKHDDRTPNSLNPKRRLIWFSGLRVESMFVFSFGLKCTGAAC